MVSGDDKNAVQALYGPKRSVSSVPRSGPSIPKSVPRLDPNFNNDNICARPKVDAIFLTADRSTYVFQGDNYWKLTKDSVAPGYPRKIYQDWRGVPSNIDAAFTWESTRYIFDCLSCSLLDFDCRATYFIKGSKYWKFENMKAYPGYPKVKYLIVKHQQTILILFLPILIFQDVNDGFPGIPSNVDAAFVWAGNGKIYFFKDSKYWKFDPESQPHVRTDQYPKV